MTASPQHLDYSCLNCQRHWGHPASSSVPPEFCPYCGSVNIQRNHDQYKHRAPAPGREPAATDSAFTNKEVGWAPGPGPGQRRET